MRRLFALLGLLLVLLLVASFLGPVVEHARAQNALASAEERLRDAERQADQAAREHQARKSDDHRAGLEQTTNLVSARLEERRVAGERRAASKARLADALARWARLVTH